MQHNNELMNGQQYRKMLSFSTVSLLSNSVSQLSASQIMTHVNITVEVKSAMLMNFSLPGIVELYANGEKLFSVWSF